jgi:hypothetical protein
MMRGQEYGDVQHLVRQDELIDMTTFSAVGAGVPLIGAPASSGYRGARHEFPDRPMCCTAQPCESGRPGGHRYGL